MTARAASTSPAPIAILDELARRGLRWLAFCERVCPRCGGDVYRDGDTLRCWQCDEAEQAEDALRADFHRLAGELGGAVVEE